MSISLLIRVLTVQDAESFQELRLHGLKSSPESFGSSYEDEIGREAADIEQMLAARPNAVFGAFAGAELVGTAGFVTTAKVKQKHKGLLWGVFVHSNWRGHHLGRQLTLAVIDHARNHVDTLHATVMAANLPARALYLSLGFTVFGFEKDALRINGQSYDDELLRLDLR
ncbi:GNAT family N-acetyltransferase [Phyllobacterium myrsinacearum]|uniref:RimJ/RimL family protein N-acetyltransferase n=1 Tax=Phyllobacterium myrsinacearum TaxID=28101 RepID=A0A839EFJ1_9HYPH|nr:GNAT family N-acetyltransferase [Phyllobacterium myrsinacearum]MBA8878731.1 RimJ/RimL family protein N-acetyltransferase [Phyllobacterium myrsinacearum]